MAGLGEFFGNLIGGSSPPPPIAADPVTSYPTPEDAAYARKYDFGYGTGNEPYIQGNVARIVGAQQGKNFVPLSAEGLTTGEATGLALDDRGSRNVDLRTPETAPISDKLGTTMAQAALAANRIPVAHLGFDPSQAAVDVKMGEGNIAGAYSPSKDSMYISTGVSDPSAIVHESIHRGINKLKQDPAVAELLKKLPSEELIVRYLMATQAGDPEKNGGKVDQSQRASAMYVLGQSGMYKREMDQLNRAAEDAYAARRPGGPR
jgi:hypothetical protein